MAEANNLPREANNLLAVVLIGNPNTGKTTLFNALTGLRHRVGNYPGVTVETKTGKGMAGAVELLVTDVPGTYSLSPRSPDEMLAVDILLGHRGEVRRPDVVLCIVDASNLERNLYLTTQVMELGLPVVVALNMMDVAASHGVRIDHQILSERCGVTMVPIQANSKKGLAALGKALREAVSNGAPTRGPQFPECFELEVARLAAWYDGLGLENKTYSLPRPEPFLWERALLDADGHVEKVLSERCGAEVNRQLADARARLQTAGHAPLALEARTRYGWIGQQVAGTVHRPATRPVTLSDRIDRIVLHRFGGLVLFLVIMAVLFQTLFEWAQFFMDPIKNGFSALGNWVGSALPEGAIRSLVVDGIIAGAGNVMIFLPQIMILFGFIAILEDCGYLARAAFLMDKLMSRCGLSGKSFIPMLSSLACAVPGIMAARTIEDRRDRLATILVAPLMSCSARLPVYTLLTGAFVPARALVSVGGFTLLNLQGVVLLVMYLIGFIVAPLVAWLLKRTLLRGETPVFLMELPSYKMPSLITVGHRMVDRGFAFVQRAATVILATTVVLWALQYYPRPTNLEEVYHLTPPTTALAWELQAGLTGGLGALPTAAMAEHHHYCFPEDKNSEESPPDGPPTARSQARRSLDNAVAAAYQEQSFLGRLGKSIEPAVKPLGWDWRIGMAAIASFPAREVVIGAMGTIFNVGADAGDDENLPILQSALRDAQWPDSRPLFDLPTALSLMVFFALCCQCGATLAVIRRETNTWSWPIFTFVYMTALAYVSALIVYQIGIRLV